MATPPTSRVQCMLQSAVQAVEWTYSLFWQLCPQQGVLVWGDGYYNGAIKTRKTVQPMVVSDEETSLQRSQQLRDLYDSLSAGESNQQARRPCAALSPEDLTESEWFYLMCVSFTFPPGVGLPGKAYAKRKHLWLTGANEVDSKVFSRAILAKSARIQTVVCIPLLDGVVEFGTTERIQEDLGFLQHVKSFFIDHHRPHPPKPALSEHSTSNPTASSEHTLFPSPSLPPVYAAVDPTSNTSRIEEEEEDGDGDGDGDEEGESDSESETRRNSHLSGVQNPYSSTATLGVAVVHTAAEPSELMQLEMSEDIRLGSPDNDSNNLDSDFHILGGSQGAGNPADSYRTESTHRWPFLQDPLNGSLQPPTSGALPLDESMREDSHYSQTVSTLLEHQSSRRPDSSSTTTGYVMYSSDSAFVEWTNRSDYHLHVPVEGTSQWLLKYILFSVPFLYPKSRDDVIGSPKSRDAASDSASRFRKATAQDELSANHVLAERRRREKLNERFIVLRSLVPFVTKMDKASILGDTIEYLKQLLKKIQDLEARTRQMEVDQRSRGPPQVSGVAVVDRARVSSPSDKKKLRIVEGSGGPKPKAIHSQPPPPPPPPPPRHPSAGVDLEVEVSIIEGDGLVEMQCPYREGLLLDVMKILRELRVEITTVQSSLTNGVFVAELRAKVKENVNGRRASIAEVKRAIRQSIPTTSDSSICS